MGSTSASPFVMHVERDMKLAVPDRFRMPSLAGVGEMYSDRRRRATTIFYDTPELTLGGWGALLRYRDREGWTVKLPTTLASAPSATLDRPEQAFAGKKGEPPAAALELLTAFLRGRTVGAVARMTTSRRRIEIGDGRSVFLDVVDDRARTSDPEARTLRQIEIELRDEAGADVRDEIVRRLVRAGAETGDTRTKYAWVLGDRIPVREAEVPYIGQRSTAGEVIRASLASAVIALVTRDGKIRAGGDPEAVHDARVGARRLRSDLRAFTRLLDRDWTANLRAELGWLGQALGTVRDREVLLDRIRADRERLGQENASALLATLDEEISYGRAELDDVMRSDRYLALLARLLDAAKAPQLAVVDGPAVELLRPSVDRTWRRLRRVAKVARRDGTAEELHRVRIEAKRLRYASEALTPVFGKKARRLARAANAVQDVLGEHQDAVVARDWLRSHAEVNGARTAFAVGELAALQVAKQDSAKARWVAGWRAVRRRRPTKWK